MTEQEFSVLVSAMKAVYADPKFISDRFAIKTWYNLLKDISYQSASMALQRYMSTRRFTPTPADIREMVFENENQNAMNELEAWAVVYKAICNSNYNYKEEFEKLPELCQRTVRRPEMLKEWASLDIEVVQTVIKSNFEKTFKEEKKASKESGQMPEKLKSLIEETCKKMIPANKEKESPYTLLEPYPQDKIVFLPHIRDSEKYGTKDEISNPPENTMDRVEEIWRKLEKTF